mmetsp:Transcript_24154/g.59310  ORF Transcript_24154/g.59310 Transcript_24154/m.59310 type:complete len:293 (-) Transcript_24154:131-1009(-)
MSTSSLSMSLRPSLAGSRIWSSVCSLSLAWLTFCSSFTMVSMRSTAYAMAFAVRSAAFLIRGSSEASLTDMASASPGAISTTTALVALRAAAACTVSAPSCASLPTMPTGLRDPAVISASSSSACATPSSPLGLLCITSFTPVDASTAAATAVSSEVFFPLVTTCTSVLVKSSRVSGSSYPNSHTSSATPLRYRRSSSLFCPVPTSTACAPPHSAPSPSFQLASRRFRRPAHTSASMVGAPIAAAVLLEASVVSGSDSITSQHERTCASTEEIYGERMDYACGVREEGQFGF